LIAKREVSSRAVIEAHLERISAVNPQINAMPVVLEREALATADAVDRAIAKGERGGPLNGVPLSIKANIDLCSGPPPPTRCR